MIVDSYDVVFGQLDPEEMRRVNRSRNYAQALVSDPRDVYSAFDEVEQEFGARKVKYAAQGYDPFSTFNPDAPSGVDPFTGATARDYAELLYPVVDGVLRTGAAAGANTLGAAYQAAGHMLSTFVDMGEYLSKGLGVPRSELFDKMAKATVARGDQFRKYAQEEGIGPVTNWLTEVLGQAPAGIADFMLNVPFYGTKGAMKAEKAGDNEFVGFLKGAIERGLMGQVLHAAATLSRPLRMGVTGAVFEEQARHEGITDPEELLKAFATGSLFGVVGGKGKYGPHEIRKELANLEMEAREWIEGLDPRAVIGERGSNKGSYIGDPITPWLDRYEKIAKGEGTARDVTTLRNQTVAVIDRSLEYYSRLAEETGMVDSPEVTDLIYALRQHRKNIDEARNRADTVTAIDRFVHATHGKGELLLRGMYGDNQGIAEAGAKLQEALDRLAGKSPVEGKKVLERGMAGDDISADLLKSGIPGFKNTEEAEAFGKKATPEQVARMKEVLERGYDDVASRKDAVAEALKAGDFEPTNALMKDIHRNQLLREAIESAGEKPPEPPPPGGGTKGGAGGGGKGEEPKFPVIPREEPKKYTKVLWAKKGQDRAIDPHGRELLHDVTEIEVGVEGETGKPGGKKRYLWEVTKEEGEALLRANGLSPELHKLAIDKALLQGKNVPLEAMRGYFPEGDLLVMEGIDGIFGLKEYEMQKWLDMKTDAALLYEHTKKMLTEKDRRDIKARVREVTGQAPASDIIEMREDQLLRNQLKMEALAARDVFRTGLKEGQLLHAKRFQEIIEMARERGDARREINYMIRELRTVDPDKMTAHCSDEVHRLLDHLDLKKLSTNKRISLEKTLDFLSRRPDTELPDYVFDDLARLSKTPIRDLSYYEIQSIHKAVMSLAAQSERVQYLNVKMRRMKVDEAIKQSLSEMRDPVRIQQDIISTRPSMWDKFKGLGHWIRVNLGLRQDSYDLIVESLAGTDSVMYDVLYRGPKRGIVKQKEAQQKAERNFRDSLKADGFFDSVKNPDKWMDERVRVGRFELSRGERMALYMHSLNADNAKAILEGGFGFKNPPPSSGLTPNSVVRITEQELADITKSLTKEEMMMVKAAQSMFRDQGVDLANEFYRLNKYRMPPQENYYPKDVMPLRRGGLDLETEEGLEAFRQFTARVGIDKSMLIERQGSVAPIYLNDLMTDINRSVRRASAYLGLEDPMMNASRMLYDSTFKRNIIDRYGRDTWVELEKGLKDIAGSYRSWTSLEKGLTLLKTRAVSSALSINPWVWLNQPFSLATYWAYIEPRYLAKGLIDSITHPKDTLDGLRMYSAELIDRLKTGYDRDVAAVYAAERDKAFYKGKSTLTEKGITPTKYFDLTAVVPGMKAAVYKALEEFQTGELSRPVRQALNVTPEEVMGWTPEQKVAKAHEFADWVTQRTQAQSTPEHRSPLSRGTPLEQMFTAFTSQTNVMLGLVRRTYRDYQRTRDPEALRAMLKAWTSVFVLNAAAMIGVDRLRDLVYGRDSKSIVSGFIDNTASLMYFVRDIVRTMTSFIEEGHRGKESTVPLARFAETLKDLAIHFHDSFSDNHFTAEKAQLGVIDSLLQLGSIYTGLPYQTPKRLLQAATGNNPPPKHRKGEDKSFIDELLED